MTKKEVIWREILFQKRQHNIIKFTQKELAHQFNFSLSTVSHALKLPRCCHAITVTGRFFILEDYKKLLILLASERKLQKDIYYQSWVDLPSHQLESLMPPQVIFALFSGFKFSYKKVPADYDHVYIYAGKKYLDEILIRLPKSENKKSKNMSPNFFIIEPDLWLQKYPPSSFEQLYTDIWNAPEWYAKDFLKELEQEME